MISILFAILFGLVVGSAVFRHPAGGILFAIFMWIIVGGGFACTAI